MDVKAREELCATIEKLTRSGNPALDQELVKKLKNTCKGDDALVRAAYKMMMSDLGKKHAEIRLSAFQLIDYFFTRSHLFREMLISDFSQFASLVTGTDPECPLPAPKDAAARLKKASLLAVREWHHKYGHGYPKLKLGFNHLKFNKKIDFEQLVSRNQAERRRREEREQRRRDLLQQRTREVKQEMTELRADVESCLTEIDACFNLLLPRFDLPDIYSSRDDNNDTTGHALAAATQDSTTNTVGEGSATHSDTRTAGVGGVASGNADSSLKSHSRRLSSQGSFVSISEGTGSEREGEEEEEEEVKGGRSKELCIGGVAMTSTSTCKGSLIGHRGSHDGDISKNDEMSGSDSDSDEVEWRDVESAVDYEVCMQEHGLTSHGFSVPVRLGGQVEVRETEDNSSILSTLRESSKLLRNHHLTALNKCLEWMTKAGEDEAIRAAIDIKGKIYSALSKYQKLNVKLMKPEEEGDDLPDSVPESSQDSTTSAAPMPQTEVEWKFGTNLPNSITATELELDPTTPQAQLAALKKKVTNLPSAQKSESSNGDGTATLKTEAPVVPFGMDLYHWEKSSSDVEARTLAPVGSLHRFWAQETEVNISKDEQDRLKCRTILFPGQFQPVVRSCRAPLPSGKLCPRKDRHKCPFHGVIIPRDEAGNPVGDISSGGGSGGDDDDSARQPSFSLPGSSSTSSSEPLPLWQDPELQQEIMAAKGVDLHITSKKGKGRGKRKKFPGLTDLKAETDTPRNRLAKKVLSRRSLKRISESVNELATKKFNDKFGNNFNYALKN